MRLATTFQRLLRSSVDGERGRTAMLGWSRGGELAYAYAALESQLPASARNIDALIPADTALNYAPSNEFRPALCDYYQQDKAALADGTAAISIADYARIGRLALRSPEAESEDVPGYTNRQAGLAYGTGIYGVFNASYHFLGARFDDEGNPTSLRYTRERRWFRLLTGASPWESFRTVADGTGLFCGAKDVKFDDHIADVRLPVLYLAAAGGLGETGRYSTTLVGSGDVDTVIVRLRPPGQESTDFGHVDLWTATDAPELAWRPLLQWLRRH